MRKFLATLLIAIPLFAQTQPSFDDFFVDKSLRVEFYQTGNAQQELITLDRLVQEPNWPGSTHTLISPFDYGRYAVRVFDSTTSRLLYTTTFDCMFGEYRTTSPAIAGVQKTFSRALRVPFPKKTIRIDIEVRDKAHVLHPLFSRIVNPSDFHIVRESAAAPDEVITLLNNGDPHNHVDIVFLAEGYAAADREKFKADAERLMGRLFSIEPYKSMKDRFNISAVLHPSPDRGVSEPRNGSFRATAFHASFDSFDLDRYLLTEEGKRIREVAAQVPYDAIVILANSSRYGGGGIYNDYCITTVDHPASPMVLVHEFGHAFAGLADEYYSSDVAYNDFYPKGIEPLEPNITALLDPGKLKWKDLVTPGTPLPTEWGKSAIDSLGNEMQKNRTAMDAELSRLRKAGAPDTDITTTEQRFKSRGRDLGKKIDEVRGAYRGLEDTVGAFEGAGYTTQGLYRPMIYCIMISSPKNEFCRVCQRATRQMIDYFSGR
jgi:hypothetical protein